MFMPVALGDCDKLSLTEIQKTIFPKQLLQALAYIHDRCIAHRDIKPHNILIMDRDTICLADFGLALDNPDSLTHKVATLWYRAPEMLLRDPEFDRDTYIRADIWSYGITIYEMLTGSTLLPGDSEIDQLFRTFQIFGTPVGPYWENLPEWEPKFPQWKPSNTVIDNIKQYPDDIQRLVIQSLEINPRGRPTAQALLGEPNEPVGHRIQYPVCSASPERTITLSWLFEVALQRKLDKRCHFLASWIYDTYTPTKNFQLVGCACMYIASEHIGQYKNEVDYDNLVEISDNTFTKAALETTVNDICRKIGFDIQIDTCYDLVARDSPNRELVCVLLCWINSAIPPLDPVARVHEVRDLVQVQCPDSPHKDRLNKLIKSNPIVDQIQSCYNIDVRDKIEKMFYEPMPLQV